MSAARQALTKAQRGHIEKCATQCRKRGTPSPRNASAATFTLGREWYCGDRCFEKHMGERPLGKVRLAPRASHHGGRVVRGHARLTAVVVLLGPPRCPAPCARSAPAKPAMSTCTAGVACVAATCARQ